MAQTAQVTAIDFGISPNPNNGQFNLSYSDEQDTPAQLLIIDQSGRQISALNLSAVASQQLVFQGIPSGFYWIQLKTQKGKIGVKQLQIVK
ncbi:MAG: T9SS type A sorting domain-containing protein [Lewinellaceae bacterium]|nr:T9SS type A sorting domain-containing protein [Lewinellaceae bacterium]